MSYFLYGDSAISLGSGATKLNDLEIFFQTSPYWYYHFKRCVISMEKENIFKWKHYQPDIIVLTVQPQSS